MTIKANVTGTGNSAAAASAIVGGMNTTTAAAGNSQATATLLPRVSNLQILSGTGGVVLAPGVGTTQGLAAGDWQRIINHSGASISVYPPTGGKINNGSANAAVTLSSNKTGEFVSIDGKLFGAIISFS